MSNGRTCFVANSRNVWPLQELRTGSGEASA